jgi:D-alanine-D-alanine ligase
MSGSEKIRVAILFFGQSAEHEISILSARNVFAALDRSRFEPVLIGIDKAGRWLTQDPKKLIASERDPRLVHVGPGLPVPLPLSAGPPPSQTATVGKIDVVFPVLHGTLGEDGAVQGLLEIAGIPCVGARVPGSAIGTDKDVMKRLPEAGIPVATFRTVRHDDFLHQPEQTCCDIAALGFPLFTKPANGGSSVGIRKVTGAADLLDAWSTHSSSTPRSSPRRPSLGANSSSPSSTASRPPSPSPERSSCSIPTASIRTALSTLMSTAQSSRRRRGSHRKNCPARRSSPDAHSRFSSAKAMARIDLFLKPDATLLMSEINTIPGFTAILMYPRLWAISGMPPTELVTRLIDLALHRGKKRQNLRRSAVPGT